MVFSNRNSSVDKSYVLTLGDNQVKFCPHGKFLGLILGDGLKFAEYYIHYICTKTSEAVGIF